MKSRGLTMKDIAAKAGVSITTVSHVINKTRHVNQETQDAVLKAMNDLHYTGRTSRKSGKIKYVGVIIADVREDYYISIIKAIETTATDFGISVLFCDSEDDPEKEERNIHMVLDSKVSGIILAPIQTDHIPRSLKSASIPVVLIDRQYENHSYLFVGINNFASAYAATGHLIDKGCKRIGFVGYSETVYTIRQRTLGYRARIMEREDLNSPAVLALSYHKEDSYPRIKQFIETESLDGLICATSTVCYEVVSVLDGIDNAGKDPVRIVSYDDNRWFDYVKYPISVILQPTAEIGSSALENLLQLIEQADSGTDIKRELFFDTSIIDRLN